MRYEFDTVTTRTGDNGKSSMFSGDVLMKHDIVFETVGELDHLNSLLGVTKVMLGKENYKAPAKYIDSIQSDIIRLSSQIATNYNTPDGRKLYEDLQLIEQADIDRLEKYQRKLLNQVHIEPVFINPGENALSAQLDVARTQTRKAERRIVQLIGQKTRVDLYDVQKYVNRLSDVLFVMARYFAVQR